MRRLGTAGLLPAGVAALGAAALAVWLLAARAPQVQARLPGQELALSLPLKVAPRPQNMGTTVPGPGVPSALTGSWPQFRGADRSNIVRESLRLARAWPAGGPPVVWKLPLGEGHAGAAVRNGCLYVDDYDRDRQEDAVRCLSLDDAREVWRYTYSVVVKRNHGMSRTVPAVTDRYVVALGPQCHVVCLDARTGALVWKFDLARQFGTTVPPWYAGQCPLIDGDAVILAPGGEPLMMAVDLASGRILWRTPNPGGWGMTHSSVTPMDYAGGRQYVYCSTGGVVGVAAQDGRVLWTEPGWKIALATVPSPLVVPPDRIFLTGGYNSGSLMLRLEGDPDHITVKEVYRLKFNVFGADQQTPILYKDHIYGVTTPGELACLDLDGKRLWSSGAARRFGLGPFILADGMILVLGDEDGTLHLVAAEPGGYHEFASAKLLSGFDAWAPMAVASGRLFLRDLTTMLCVDLPQEGP
jgi:outer membrane protein assembly factor BamB